MTNLDCDDDIEIPRMKVPTCQLEHGFGTDAAGLTGYPDSSIAMQDDAEAYFSERGVTVLATCTPYQVGNLPVRGEHCAWMESSAVVYCNSVLGARTNCEGSTSTGAAALTGRIPYWGNHLPENRSATHLIRADVEVGTFQDWGMLGYFVGDAVQEARPAVVGALGQPDAAALKHFGAATATSGGVELYHLPGITPEAPDLAAAFGGGAVPEPIVYDERARREVYDALNSQGSSDDVDFILLGCPHASLDQLAEIAGLLDGRTLHPDTELWVMTPRALRSVADRSGFTRAITRAGGRVLTDSCPAMSRAAPPGTRVFATDSAKQAHYLPAILGIEAWFGTLGECIDAAVTGRWHGGLAA
ncbi:aconitase X catalytic domain-containing protein [Microbacterium elymi]|uniref:Aconitase X catalytic domain-containing protein n=1 Tax=Microbacterium elymi TaxID=2909587 RepID=A0ABY5NHD5_9MICO|nr:aconitase X catalytic domain-containing protein [Microbacterium elymi]UUT34595.1 aconitase X catalytic domain-containing protein [Microbacterium elymi]